MQHNTLAQKIRRVLLVCGRGSKEERKTVWTREAQHPIEGTYIHETRGVMQHDILPQKIRVVLLFCAGDSKDERY